MLPYIKTKIFVVVSALLTYRAFHSVPNENLSKEIAGFQFHTNGKGPLNEDQLNLPFWVYEAIEERKQNTEFIQSIMSNGKEYGYWKSFPSSNLQDPEDQEEDQKNQDVWVFGEHGNKDTFVHIFGRIKTPDQFEKILQDIHERTKSPIFHCGLENEHLFLAYEGLEKMTRLAFSASKETDLPIIPVPHGLQIKRITEALDPHLWVQSHRHTDDGSIDHDGYKYQRCYALCRGEEVLCELRIDGDRCVELDIESKKKRQGYGSILASHIVRELIEQGINISWTCDVNNVPSVGVARKIGLKETAEYIVFVPRKLD